MRIDPPIATFFLDSFKESKKFTLGAICTWENSKGGLSAKIELGGSIQNWAIIQGVYSQLTHNFLAFQDLRCLHILAVISQYQYVLVVISHISSIGWFYTFSCAFNSLMYSPYFQKIVLSGCTHLTAPFLFLAVLPRDLDVMQKARIIRALVELDSHRGDYYKILEKSPNILCFGHVNEVNISMCHKMNFGAAMAWLHMAFPSLKFLKASHCLHFTMEDLLYLIRKCLLMNEVDLTVDVSPVTSTISVLSATIEGSQLLDGKPRKKLEKVISLSNIGKYSLGKPVIANISKLTLEGRNDINGEILFQQWFYLHFFKPSLLTASHPCPKRKCFIFSSGSSFPCSIFLVWHFFGYLTFF